MSNADLQVKNNTNCTYVLSIPVVGYLTVTPGLTVFINSDLITDVKVTIWPTFPVAPIIDQASVQLFTIPYAVSLYSSCSGSNYSCKYTYLSGNNTLLEIL